MSEKQPVKVKRLFRTTQYSRHKDHSSIDGEDCITIDTSDGRSIELRVGDEVILEEWSQLSILGKPDLPLKKKRGVLARLLGEKEE